MSGNSHERTNETAYCKHGLIPEDCEYCNPRTPQEIIYKRPPASKQKEVKHKGISSITVLGKKDNMDSIPSDINILHLTSQPSAVLISEILKRCPNLTTLQTPRSHFRRLVVNNKAIAALAEEKGLVIVEGSVVDREDDLNKRYDPMYRKRRRFW